MPSVARLRCVFVAWLSLALLGCDLDDWELPTLPGSTEAQSPTASESAPGEARPIRRRRRRRNRAEQPAPPPTQTAQTAPLPSMQPLPPSQPAPQPPQHYPAPMPFPVGATEQAALGLAVDASPQDEYILRRPQYVLSYNRFRNAPNWAAWRLRADDLGSTGRTRRSFAPDPDLPPGAYRVLHTDFRASGYDRGHLVPSSHRTAREEDNAATFVMSNVLPQVHEMNAGAWESLESWSVSMARQGWTLYTYAGGLWPATCATERAAPLTEACPAIGERYDAAQRVAVPSSMWKVVVLLPPGAGPAAVDTSTPVVAVDIPNTPDATGDWRGYQLTVDALEARTGYDFLSAVPPGVQAVIESRIPSLR